MKLKYSMKSMLRKQQNSQLNSASSRVPKCARWILLIDCKLLSVSNAIINESINVNYWHLKVWLNFR